MTHPPLWLGPSARNSPNTVTTRIFPSHSLSAETCPPVTSHVNHAQKAVVSNQVRFFLTFAISNCLFASRILRTHRELLSSYKPFRCQMSFSEDGYDVEGCSQPWGQRTGRDKRVNHLAKPTFSDTLALFGLGVQKTGSGRLKHPHCTFLYIPAVIKWQTWRVFVGEGTAWASGRHWNLKSEKNIPLF